MARQPRVDLSGYVYHVINRASGRVPIFKTKKDYQLFETVLVEAQKKTDMRILAYCVMPNHFHIAVYPKNDGDVQSFMCWLTKTHTQRWHVAHQTVGYGHLYQGRYKSFIVNTDAYYFSLMKYIEQNPLRAGLVARVQDWQWGSFYRRLYGSAEQKGLLCSWPMEEDADYVKEINNCFSGEVLKYLRTSVSKGSPLGGEEWKSALIESLKLGHTMRGVGRPRNGS